MEGERDQGEAECTGRPAQDYLVALWGAEGLAPPRLGSVTLSTLPNLSRPPFQSLEIPTSRVLAAGWIVPTKCALNRY